MSLDGKDFKQAREHMNLTQKDVADHLNIGLSTYQKWEQCKRKPHAHMRRKVFAYFKEAFCELGVLKDGQKETPLHKTSITPAVTAPSAPKNSVVTFANQNFTSRLFFLVTPPYRGYEDIQSRMEGILKELHTMNSTNTNYQITRREAFTSVVASPIGALQLRTPGQTVKSGLYEIALPTCAAGIAGCWELSKSSEAVDLATAFDGVSIYLPVLDDIMQYSSHYRENASDLAARCAIVKTVLCWHCSNNADATYYAQQALDYSKYASDISLQLSAYSKLLWAYFIENERKYPLALNTALEAKRVLEQAEKKHIPIPPGIRDGTYSNLALMQAVNKQNCDEAIGKAGEVDPGEEISAFMMFTRSDMPLEMGRIYQSKGDHAKAMELFETIVDPKEFTLLAPALAGGERHRVGVITRMAQSTLNGKDRDMGEVIRLWTAGVQGAVALRSELLFERALTTYNIMRHVWLGERRIEELAPLTVHWPIVKK